MRIIRLKEVTDCTGLGRSSIYNFMSEGRFPMSVSLGDRAVGWVESEVLDWIDGRVHQRELRGKPKPFSMLYCPSDATIPAKK